MRKMRKRMSERRNLSDLRTVCHCSEKMYRMRTLCKSMSRWRTEEKRKKMIFREGNFLPVFYIAFLKTRISDGYNRK